jgi:D-aspartate ligase
MEKKAFLPIILGSDENAYGIARAFHEKYGIIPAVMCKAVYPASRFSKIMDIIKIENLNREDVFIENIKKTAEEKLKEYEKLILVPCSDYYIEYTSKNENIIGKYFCNKFISYALLQRFGTKEKFYKICDEFGLVYPKTVICEKNERMDIANRLPFDFPVIVKPDNSNSNDYLNCEFEGKKKVFFVWSRDEYIKIITEMNKSDYGGRLIIQDFITGDDTVVRTLNSYSNNSGKVKLMCLGQPLIESYAPLELGNYAALMTD